MCSDSDYVPTSEEEVSSVENDDESVSEEEVQVVTRSSKVPNSEFKRLEMNVNKLKRLAKCHENNFLKTESKCQKIQLSIMFICIQQYIIIILLIFIIAIIMQCYF